MLPISVHIENAATALLSVMLDIEFTRTFEGHDGYDAGTIARYDAAVRLAKASGATDAHIDAFRKEAREQVAAAYRLGESLGLVGNA